jgi:hypothetical protein
MNLSVARDFVAATAVGKLVLFGGGALDGFVRSDVVDALNTDTGSWDSTMRLSEPRFGLAATSVGGKAFFAGGSGVLEPQTALVDVYHASGIAYCTAKAGLVCGLPAIETSGVPSATSTSGFHVSAGPARGGKSGILVYGDAGAATLPFHGGTLCVSPPLRRSVGVSSGGTSGACDGAFSLDMNCFASGNCGGNPAAYLTLVGQTVHCQWWGRDSVATGSFLSDALQYSVGP